MTPLPKLPFMVAALLAVPAAPALAAHAPTSTQATALRRAVRHSKFVPAAVAAGHFVLRDARVSSAGPYAIGQIRPTGQARSLGPVDVAFKRGGGGSGAGTSWTVVSLGTALVGCDHPRLPAAVRADLRIHCG